MNKETAKKENVKSTQIIDKSLEKDILKNVKKYGYLGTLLKVYEEKIDDGRTVINLDRCKSRNHQIMLLLADGFKTTFIDNITDKEIKEASDFMFMKLLHSIPSKRLNKLFNLYCSNVVEPENYDKKKMEEFWNYTINECEDICLTK